LGTRPQFRTKKLFIDHGDATTFKVDEKITLMKWANCKIDKIEPNQDGSIAFTGTLLEEDKDFKNT